MLSSSCFAAVIFAGLELLSCLPMNVFVAIALNTFGMLLLAASVDFAMLLLTIIVKLLMTRRVNSGMLLMTARQVGLLACCP